MNVIMEGQAQPAHIAGFLMALALKGERPKEMVGFASVMRNRALQLPEPVGAVFDTCGTGGDGLHTFNVSTAAALVIAGAGVRVAKHGNRAASSKCGSADVFEALGIGLDGPPDRVIRSLDQAKLAFFFAQAWHPSMKHAAPTRKELGIRTAFNLLGPLTNPAKPARQLIGVSRPEHTELVARALGELGSERAWVVYGAGGLDEISTLGHTKVSELHRGTVNTFYVHPADAGLPIASVADLRGGTAAENAAMIEDVVGGGQGPRRDIALLNAGASLLIAGVASSLRDGVERAARTIADGGARRVLAELREVSPK
jgi:anthranilate phosphoribosyltransferase